MSNIYDISPAKSAAAVTPSDSADLTNGVCRSLYIGTTGNLAVLMSDGSSVSFVAAPNGVFPIKVKRVLSTGTTATDIVALY